MDKIQNAKQAIIDAINIIVEKKLSELKFDRTYSARISDKTQESASLYKYTILINSKSYNVTSKINYSIGDKVHVRIPNGDWAQMYIEMSEDVLLDSWNDILQSKV